MRVVDFVKSITAAAALNQFAFEHVSANTFALKYYFGLPRPEVSRYIHLYSSKNTSSGYELTII